MVSPSHVTAVLTAPRRRLMIAYSRMFIAVCTALVLAACEKPADRGEATATAPRSATRPVPQINVSSEDRFAFASPQVSEPVTPADASAAATGTAPTAAGGGLFTYDVPAGWKPAATSQFRDPNFT